MTPKVKTASIINIIGMVILTISIICMLPVTVPRLFGFQIFGVISPSMEPAVKTGSIVYVLDADPKDIEAGDIIAFYRKGEVVMHRAVLNDRTNGKITTKGDANDSEDISPVPYRDLIGKVRLHIPYLGSLLLFLGTVKGKICAACVIAGGALLCVVSSILKGAKTDKAGSQ